MSDRPRVLLLDDSVEFRMLQVGCHPGTPTAWLDAFLAPERIPTGRFADQLSAGGHRWDVIIEANPSPAALAPLDPDVVVVERHHPERDLLDRWPRLNGVVVYGRTVPPGPAALYRGRGLPVRTVHRSTTDSVADHSLLLLLALARRLTTGAHLSGEAAGSAAATPGEASGHTPTVFNWLGLAGIAPLAGRRLAVFGAGEIGAEVLRRARAFGMRLGYADQRRRPDLEAGLGARWLPVDELPGWADVVSLHLPYAPELRHVVDARFLDRLGPAGILLNTSRGLLVDHTALVAALRDERLGGAGLDVHATEPLPVDDPLRALPNAILTPHVGAGSRWVVLRDVLATIDAVAATLTPTGVHGG